LWTCRCRLPAVIAAQLISERVPILPVRREKPTDSLCSREHFAGGLAAPSDHLADVGKGNARQLPDYALRGNAVLLGQLRARRS